MEGDPRLAAVERFRRAAEAEPLVAAAFLGGSFAAGTADAHSDLDLYVVTEDADYEAFFALREDFAARWGDVAWLDTTSDFEGFGFDLVHFVLADGVTGELALAPRSRMLALHGGPYEPLVDRGGVLAGVEFPLWAPAPDDIRAEERRARDWFWLEAIELAKALGRGNLWAAQARLAAMRRHCVTLAGGEPSGRLLATFVPADAAAIAVAARDLCALHRELAADESYPDALAAVAEAKLAAARS